VTHFFEGSDDLTGVSASPEGDGTLNQITIVGICLAAFFAMVT
jgi:hypothetical protein